MLSATLDGEGPPLATNATEMASLFKAYCVQLFSKGSGAILSTHASGRQPAIASTSGHCPWGCSVGLFGIG